MTAITTDRPLVLAILDGWGLRDEREANAIALARTPIFDRLAASYPHCHLDAAGEAVGLPAGRPGYAQAAFTTLGAGRAVPEMGQIISRFIQEDGADALARHPVMAEMIARVRSLGGAVHLVGMVSPSGILGHKHLMAVMAALLSHEGVDVQVHAVLDGIDAGAQSGLDHLREFIDDISAAENTMLASIMGRAYGFDEPSDPELAAKAVAMLADADALNADYPTAHLAACYAKGQRDDRIPPIITQAYRGIRSDDAVLLLNLHAETAHGLMSGLQARLADPHLNRTPRKLSGFYSLVSTIDAENTDIRAIFETPQIADTLSQTLSQAGMEQLALTESICANQIWLNARAGKNELWPGETVLVADTPPFAKIDKRPELAAASITHEALVAMKAGTHHLITLHFPNAALFGKTGNLRATIDAVEAIDKHLGKIVAQVEKRKGTLVVVGSYGKAETMETADGKGGHRATTTAKVPFILAGAETGFALAHGTLADVAPTLLALLGIRKPAAMSGQSLLQPKAAQAAATQAADAHV
ncbi:MAG: hypothetical protein GC184_01890 [Rhizobiales bacterium]|nr:hypothetical protein [Hyphomicrobiales bacterium]